MKLKFLFLVMDLLTLLAYPIVLVHGKLHPYLKTKDGIHLTNSVLMMTIALEG